MPRLSLEKFLLYAALSASIGCFIYAAGLILYDPAAGVRMELAGHPERVDDGPFKGNLRYVGRGSNETSKPIQLVGATAC